MFYRIADLTIYSQFALPSFEGFSCAETQPDVVLVRSDETASAGTDIRSGSIVHRQQEDGWFYHSSPEDPAGLLADRSYTRLRLIGSDGFRLRAADEWFIRVAIECRLALRGYVSLHSASVAWDGHTVAFTGPSGVGKSTRAQAWIDAFSAELISGDRPLIHVKTLELYGVPWDGKEQCFRNEHYPLKAICEVRRSKTCYIRKMSFEQRRRLLLRQCFLPMWDTETSVVQMKNIIELARSAQILRIFSGPDAEDASAVYQIMEKNEFLEEKTDMKTKPGFIMRNIAGEFVLMPINENIGKFNGTLLMNEVSAFIWEKMQSPISRDDLLKAVLAEYDVEEAVAAADLDSLLEKLNQMGVIETDE